MLRKKKFDERDALDILREAFGGARTPRVAELETRKKGIRTVASDPYRESVGEDAPQKISKKLEAKYNIKREQSTIEETEEVPPPFWEQPLEELQKQQPAEKTEKPPKHTLTEEMARGAIDLGLEEKGIINRSSLKEALEHIESQRAKLSPEDRKKFEELRRQYQEQIENVSPKTVKPAPPQEFFAPEQSPQGEHPEETERIEQKKQFLAGREAEVYRQKHGAEDVAEMEKRIGYLSDNKTKNGKTDFEAIDRPGRAVEIAKAGHMENKENEEGPAPLEKTPDLGAVETQLAENSAKVNGEEEPSKEKEQSHGDHIKTFEEKITALEARINETGGTREEKNEHIAWQIAKTWNYDLPLIEKFIAELEEKQNKRGRDLLTLEHYQAARTLVAAEIDMASPKEPRALEIAAKKPKMPETVPEKATSAEIDAVFAEFGISQSDLSRVEGYRTLDENQKAFVFENLRRILYSDIESRAKALLAEETATQGPLRRAGRQAFEGFAGQGGKLAVREAKALEAIRTGGFTAHGETLQLLTDMLARHEVSRNPETGDLEVAYINSDEFGTEHADIVEEFNRAAQVLANTPEDFGYSIASKKEHAHYEAAQRQYDNARRNIFQLACARTGDFASASEFMLNRDAQVSMQRVLATYPQLETVLANIARIDNQSRAGAAVRSAISATGWKAGIAGVGSILRLSSIKTLALSTTEAATVVGGIINGVREGFRARQKAAQERKTAQQGLTRKEKAALTSGRGMLGIGKKEHLRAAGHTFRKTDFIDASNYTERIQKLLIKINDPANKKQSVNQRQLHRLVGMAEAHLAEGLVNFGRDATRLAAAYEFLNQLAHARVELTRKNWFNQKNTIPNLAYFDKEGNQQEISLPTFMESKHMRMSAEERESIKRGVLRGAAVGAVAGGVGAQFAAWIKDTYGDEIQEWITSARAKLGFGAAAIPPPKNLPVGSGKTSEVLIHANEAMRDAKLAAGRAEAAASITETEFAAQKAETAASTLKTSPSGSALKLPEAATPPLEGTLEYTNLANIKKGEGIWHAVRRQLNYQMSHTAPEEFAKRYGLSPEDIKLYPEKSVERITGNLLADQDYIKPKGALGAWTETRLKPGARVLLGEDGKIEITGKGKFTYEWQKPAAASGAEPITETSETVKMATGPILIKPEKGPISIPERLLSPAENMARKMSGINLDTYAKVRDASLAEFLKKPPRGKGFQILAKILQEAKPSKTDLRQNIGEFLSKRFSG